MNFAVSDYRPAMEPYKFTEYFQNILFEAVSLNEKMDASGLLILFDSPIDWKRLKKLLGDTYFVAAATNVEALSGAKENDIKS